LNRNDVNWKGFWPAAPTPFTREGVLDDAAWRELLQLYAGWGMHGILVNGTTGEWYSQTPEERRRLAEIAVEELKGKMTVVIGCTTFTAKTTIELARHARDIGADGVLSTPPPYAAPSPREIVHYYQTISDAVDIPLMVYNWPRGTAVEIPTELALKLAEVPNVVAIKNSTPNRISFFDTLEAVVDKIRVFGGFANKLGMAALKEIGGDGSIGGGALLGHENAEFFDAFWAGNYQRSEEIAAKSTKLNKLLGTDRAPLPGVNTVGRYGTAQAWLKAAMNMMGQPGGYPRDPLLPVEDPEDLAGIRHALETVGLLQPAAAAR
jgi:1-pyrroline-4-hydroxy-2-carboxylate deaminase